MIALDERAGMDIYSASYSRLPNIPDGEYRGEMVEI